MRRTIFAALIAVAALLGLSTPALAGGHGVTPVPKSVVHPSGKLLTCGTSCYHIQEKNGVHFWIGFNSDTAGYWLRSKDDAAARDIILVSVSGTCNHGVSCFEAKMLTVNNLEVVTTTCTEEAGNTLQLQNTSGTTGDVYEFVTDNNGDQYILNRNCGDFVSFQDTLDAPMQLGSNPGQYWRVLYFAQG